MKSYSYVGLHLTLGGGNALKALNGSTIMKAESNKLRSAGPMHFAFAHLPHTILH